jgi:hypothetical protein
LLLLGAGGHARACIDVIEREARFAIAGLAGHAEEQGTTVFGYPVVGGESQLPELLASHAFAVVTVGQIKTPDVRMRLFELVTRHGRPAPPIVSPAA